jgi:hypothetical protein
MRTEIQLQMGHTPGAERDLKKISQILESAGGFSREDEARVHELEVKISIENRQFAAAKDLADRSAFLP